MNTTSSTTGNSRIKTNETNEVIVSRPFFVFLFLAKLYYRMIIKCRVFLGMHSPGVADNDERFTTFLAVKKKRVWYPEELQQQEFLVGLYQDASSETSDLGFSVKGTVYWAHKDVLSVQAKKLYDIAMEYDNNNDSPIPIYFMREEIFKSILKFVYTVETPEIENAGIAIELIVATNYYGVTQLKLYVESIIVDKFLTAGNAEELLIFAHLHSCALLKEAAKKLEFVRELNEFYKLV